MQKQKIKDRLMFLLKVAIVVAAVWYLKSRMSLNDRVMGILPGQTIPQWLTMARRDADDTKLQFEVINPGTGETLLLPRTAADVQGVPQPQVVNEPDRAKMLVTAGGKQQYVVGLDLSPDLTVARRVLVVETPQSVVARWYPVSEVPDYHMSIPHPRVQKGILRMVREADPKFLLAALGVIPITMLITSLRWQALMKALDINLTLWRTFELNMVGLFWNSAMPGSTGGDVLKAYQVARVTHHRTRAVMSVLVDRGIGLVALVILGGVMATLQAQNPLCRQVALGAAAILAGLAGGSILFYVPTLRKISGLDFVIRKLPMQKQVVKAIETMHIYGRHWRLMIVTLIGSIPVHMTVVFSAMMCGFAFNLPVKPFYYWTAVPVIVLAGSIPISPQGAGVMEFFAIKLLEPQGATVAQAFALTMSIRLTQIFWNLTGGFFALRGHYHAPTQTEQKQIEAEDEDEGGSLT